MKEQYNEALKAADDSAVDVFAGNLHRLLLTPLLASYVHKCTSYSSSTPISSHHGDNFGFRRNAGNTICAIDPGFTNGHKCVVFSVNNSQMLTHSEKGGSSDNSSGTCAVLATRKLFVRRSHEQDDCARAGTDLAALCRKHGVALVVIGDGVGSEQAIRIVQHANKAARGSAGGSNVGGGAAAAGAGVSGKKRKLESSCNDGVKGSDSSDLFPSHYAVVSECGASVYSASEVARRDYPGLDISFLGCMSIGSRLIDSLSELVKIPPESLGVGLYQHDIHVKRLQSKLKEVVEICVNEVGVDLNTASMHILKYISGIDEAKAKAIVAYRDELSSGSGGGSGSERGGGSGGAFTSLAQLKDVKGIGPVAFKNAAGFLRVYGGSEALDCTCIHPEQYKTARTLLKLLGEYDSSSGSSSGSGSGSGTSSINGSGSRNKQKASTKFTSGDIGSPVLQHTLCDFVAALMEPQYARHAAAVALSNDWCAQLKLSKTELLDMLDWLSLRTSAITTTNVTAATRSATATGSNDASTGDGGAKKQKREMTEKGSTATSVPPLRTETQTRLPLCGQLDDIRVVKGVPPVLIRIDDTSSAASSASASAQQGAATTCNASTAPVAGQKFQAKVKNIAPFGAFMDLGPTAGAATFKGTGKQQRDGLLHVGEFRKASNRLGLSLERLTVGQVIAVVVLAVDTERGRISLGLDL